MKAFFLLSYIPNEEENKTVYPSLESVQYMLNILKTTLAMPGHSWTVTDTTQVFHADEILEVISNLLGCSEDNISNFLEVGLLPILADILNGSLYGPATSITQNTEGLSKINSGRQIQPNQYSLVEKTVTANCCWTLCFNAEARKAIVSNSKLSEGLNTFLYTFIL